MASAIKKRQQGFKKLQSFIKENSYSKGMLRNFDWWLFALIVLVGLFGVVSIFAATATPTDNSTSTFLETVSRQSTYYARLQLGWLAAGIVVVVGMCWLDYHLFEQLSNVLYWINIGLLVVVLFGEAGRGNMAGWFRWASGQRTIQPSEFGKIAIIISLARLFSLRKKPIMKPGDLVRPFVYVLLPLALIVAQPDVGTALVYIAIFAVMIFFSGTNARIIVGAIALALLLIIPLWYMLNVAEDNFRLARLMVYLDPTYDTNGSGMQVANAKIAVGSGGLWGKGMFSEGCFASLNYIPDDYTDFIFAIVCESFGFFGASMLLLAFAAILLRMVRIAYNTKDLFGRYCVIGVIGMVFFHVLENAGMVVGLLPVTGIPMPLVSYGGSNMLATMAGFGLVLSISMRNRSERVKAAPREIVQL